MAASTSAPTATAFVNYGQVFNSARDEYAATTEIFSDMIELDPASGAITIWALSTRAGTLNIYYLPLAGAAVKLDGTTSDTDTNYSTTLGASVLMKVTIKAPIRHLYLSFTPSAATAGSIYADVFGSRS